MKRSLFLLATCLCGVASISTAWGHEHLAFGTVSVDPGAQIFFANAADYGSDSGFVFALDEGEDGSPYAGYYYTGDITFSVLPATPDLGGPAPGHPALGAHLEVQMGTIEGPKGSHLQFWESPGDDLEGTEITWSAPVGAIDMINHFAISENDGSPGADPYGHIHGRIFSVDQPGLYKVGFRIVDTSHNGPNNGPIHTPSDAYALYFQAGLTIGSLSLGTDGASLFFATPSGIPDSGLGDPKVYTVEAATTLGPTAQWAPVADPIVGDDHVHAVVIPKTDGNRFFRLSVQ
ncbi:MAG TPA: hypothetical protein VMF06_07335 [Candidatus Limnocylindria bacterium]|jgi:hypothetical protein|nr:hypothetical protein [Candidatus Limnocylindria bacterium]